ncbi:MAG: hypothetical protein WCG55_02080 [bacterium]
MRKRFLIPFLTVLVFFICFIVARKIENARAETLVRERIAENLTIAKYSTTSNDRLMKAVVTLPKGDALVGLHDGTGIYPYMGSNKKIGTGTVKLGALIGRKFIQSDSGGTKARLDVFAPMTLSEDSMGGSTYVVLFGDRGDSVIERSYVRLGDATSVVIKAGRVLEADTAVPNEEYRLDIMFEITHGKKDVVTKETIIPVVDGLFSTLGVVTQ